jgi:hypothetical protein
MTNDILKDLRRYQSNFRTEDKWHWLTKGAADRIEKLEKALLSVSALNNSRDRFSSEIDKIILDALEGKKDEQS